MGLIRNIWKTLLSHSGLQRFAQDTAWLYAERVVGATAGFFVSIWVIRYLGPARYGLLTYAAALCLLMSSILSLGLHNIVRREVLLRPEEENAIMSSAFAMVSGGSFIAYGLLLIFVFFIEPLPEVKPLLCIVGLTFFAQPFQISDWWFRARQRSKYAASAQSIAIVISAGLKVTLILQGMSLLWFGAILAAEWFVRASLLHFYLRKFSIRISLRLASRRLSSMLFADSKFLLLQGVVGLLYLRMDHIMLKYLSGVREVGIYGSAVRIAELFNGIPMVLAVSVFPILVRSSQKNRAQEHENRLQLYFDLMVFLAIPVTVIMWFAAPYAVDFLFGEPYRGASIILQIQISAFLFVCLRYAQEQWLVVENRVAFSLVSSLVGVLINFLLNLYLIPLWGAPGAATATLLTQGLLVLGILHLYRPCWPAAQMTWKALAIPFRLREITRMLMAVFQQAELQ